MRTSEDERSRDLRMGRSTTVMAEEQGRWMASTDDMAEGTMGSYVNAVPVDRVFGMISI